MVTDHDRAVFELIIDPAIAEGFELVPVTIEATECALLASVAIAGHDVTLSPVAVIVNLELLKRITFRTGT